MKNSRVDIVRAWKDPEYLASLSDEDRAGLPANPAGAIELSDEDLGRAQGGVRETYVGPYSAIYTITAECQGCNSWRTWW
ncbi:MAG: mersacidin/lichenicidin family type 2 lantibiotic [Deltaproteobacteria bacterium]|nr:mersacidin/lichenicidin family type 2 lantibiotic [Deltaproteobacteria bacterium]